MAGGKGKRLYPTTISVTKQLFPVFDKPMIYYPLSVLMELGIRDILLISTIDDISLFKRIFGTGKTLGINLKYLTQNSPDGIPQAFLIGRDYICEDSVALILGDNLFINFHAEDYKLSFLTESEFGAGVWGYYVDNPERFGVVEFDEVGRIKSIEEKPSVPKSNCCITGLYFYDKSVIRYVERLSPSKRGELEISDLNLLYLRDDRLHLEMLKSNTFWFDTGTPESLLNASNFVRRIQKDNRLIVACLEEIAYKKGWIGRSELIASAKKMETTDYGKYLEYLACELMI